MKQEVLELVRSVAEDIPDDTSVDLIKEGLMERDKGIPLERKKRRALKNPEKRRKHRKQAKHESSENVDDKSEA